MSEVKVNKISPRTNCGTVQLGDSGDTITIPAGATITNNGTQTGFGRTGAVDWITTKKTATFDAVSGEGYFVDTSSGVVTVTLPASPSAGAIVAVSDYAGTSATNNITIGRNGSNINGNASNITISKNNSAAVLVYVDATQGWKLTETSNLNDIELQPEFIVATGGTESTCGDFKIHTFTGPGTFCVSQVGNPLGTTNVDYMVVAGGGSGTFGGGGGAGGFRESHVAANSGPYTASPLAIATSLPVSVQGYPITVGAGGTGNTRPSTDGGTPGNPGGSSTFSSITSAGGGWGGVSAPPPSGGGTTGANGGSGGGGGSNRTSSGGLNGGSGNTPPVSPPQGNSGGRGSFDGPSHTAGGGGGGAGAAGSNTPSGCGPAPVCPGGAGGTGVGTGINPSTCVGTPGPVGSLRYFAGGGRGGTNNNIPSPADFAGSTGGGGAGNSSGSGAGQNGTTNTGGGAGGSGEGPLPIANPNGGSGIVIIRYKFQ